MVDRRSLCDDPHVLSGPTAKYLRFGPTLYVPAVRSDLVRIANEGHEGRRHQARTLIFCTEDAVRADQVDQALHNLLAALPRLQRQEGRFCYIRVRSPWVLGRLLAAEGIGNVEGFVIPKATARNLPDYLHQLSEHDPFELMPTLETAEAFDQEEMRALRLLLQSEAVRHRIPALRIGGNDLLNTIGVRRSPHRTIYDTAIGPVISQLVCQFKPFGFNLTAPVFEGLAHPDVLAEEVERDLDHGLYSKTAVHPDQIPIIEAGYRVSTRDLEMAEHMLQQDAPAVFRMHDTMCEVGTHLRWAQLIISRASLYGVAPEPERRAATAAPWEETVNDHDQDRMLI